MAISHWPVQERPREKLLQKGAHALSDAELLAIVLRNGIVGKSALDLARDLLLEFGGIRALLRSGWQQCSRISGLGKAKYVQLQVVLELGQRDLYQQIKQYSVLSNPKTTQQYLLSCLGGRKQEVFACLFLDNHNRILCFEEIFFGSIRSAQIHPREIVKRALAHNAAAVILSHNHPSGIAEPSLADKHITTKLQQALSLVDVDVLDHIVVGEGECVSFIERGWLP